MQGAWRGDGRWGGGCGAGGCVEGRGGEGVALQGCWWVRSGGAGGNHGLQPLLTHTLPGTLT